LLAVFPAHELGILPLAAALHIAVSWWNEWSSDLSAGEFLFFDLWSQNFSLMVSSADETLKKTIDSMRSFTSSCFTLYLLFEQWYVN
ncbi:hypothetical protein EG327_009028, partial [Venturia inaequalis]